MTPLESLLATLRNPVGDFALKFEKLANYLEAESLHPPAEKRGEAGPMDPCGSCGYHFMACGANGRKCCDKCTHETPSAPDDGKAPDPLPATLPEGTRARNGAIVRGVAVLRGESYFGDWRSPAGVQERDGHKYASGGINSIDWKEWRRTRSPEPKREGEELPTFWVDGKECRLERMWDEEGDGAPEWIAPATDSDLVAVLQEMPEEQRNAVLEPWAKAWVEVAWKENLDVSAENVRLRVRAKAAEERERATLARVATLVGELEAARARVGEAERELDAVVLWVRNNSEPSVTMRFEKMLRTVRVPAPSAPTPAVVEKPRQLVRNWCRSCDDVVTVHEGGCCSRCGSYETERQTKESPHRDSGGDPVGGFPHRFARNVGELLDEQREGQTQEAEAAREASAPGGEANGGRLDSGSAGCVPGAPRPTGVTAGNVATSDLPRFTINGPGYGYTQASIDESGGLTQEEAEEGARRMYGHADSRGHLRHQGPNWGDIDEACRRFWTDAYRFAHSEGRSSLAADVAMLKKRIDVLRASVRALGVGSVSRASDADRYLRNDDDLAASLRPEPGGGK